MGGCGGGGSLIVAVLSVCLFRLPGVARFFGSLADLLTYAPVVTLLCFTICFLCVTICFLNWLAFRERSQKADREQESELLRRLVPEDTQLSRDQRAALAKVLLTRQRKHVSSRLEPARNSADGTDWPAGEEDRRAMPDALPQDAPGSVAVLDHRRPIQRPDRVAARPDDNSPGGFLRRLGRRLRPRVATPASPGESQA